MPTSTSSTLKTIVRSVADLPDLSTEKRLCVDIESVSFNDDEMALDPWAGHRIGGIAVATADGRAWYIPIRHRDEEEKVLPVADVMAWIQKLFDDPERECFGHNIKFDLRFFAADGVVPRCKLADTMVLARLVDNTLPKLSLDYLTRHFGLAEKTGEDIDAYLKGVKSKDFGRVPVRILAPYAMNDVLITYQLRRRLEHDLADFSKPLWEMEKRFLHVLLEIELDGVRVDQMALKQEWHDTLERLIAISKEIDEIAGWEVDPNSSLDRDTLLVKQLGIKPQAYTKTGRAQWTKAVMLNLEIPKSAPPEAHRIGQLFQSYSYLSHFLATYVEGWVKRCDENGYLHPDLKQAGTTTGRLSAGNPNTQNIPVEAERFICCPEGEVGIGFDFSQVEYRMFAHYTADPVIMEAYKTDADADFHQYLADLLGVPRQFAKTMNFAFLYGMGKEKLLLALMAMMTVARAKGDAKMEEKLRNIAYVSGLAMAERAKQYVDSEDGLRAIAEKIFDDYHARFPSIRRFAKKVNEVATYRKFVRNLFGRKYDFDMSKFASIDQKKAFGPHRAVNYLIQGSCADLLRYKMVELRDQCRARYGARMFMTVHDSVYFYVPRANAAEFFVAAKKILETAPQVGVPIRCEGKVFVKNVAADVAVKEVRKNPRGLSSEEKDGITVVSYNTGGEPISPADVEIALVAAETAMEHSFGAAQQSRGYRVGRHGV